MSVRAADEALVFLGGDVMTGRGIDQALAHPSSPELYESFVRDARDYLRLAEGANGAVPAPVTPAYVWGDALAELDRAAPVARIVNLETAVTTSNRPWPGKGIHYRMHPANVDCLTAARLDCCVLANNHVMDWGRDGLADTLATLERAGMRTAGAGPDADAARAPAVVPLPGGGRVLVFAAATESSGVPEDWSAAPHRPGIALLPEPGAAAAAELASRVAAHRRDGDLVIVSIHWGGNWGCRIPHAHREFAHRLIDLRGADLVHGHSSHHPLPAEVHRGRLILYGCGDLINDHEGIGDTTECARHRMSLVRDARAPQARCAACRIVPLQLRRRLGPADPRAEHSARRVADAGGSCLRHAPSRRAGRRLVARPWRPWGPGPAEPARGKH
ncbi:MAG: CapA family protein [Burkholderiaceae bacterium]